MLQDWKKTKSAPDRTVTPAAPLHLRTVKRETTSANDLATVDSEKLNTCNKTDVPTFAARRVVDAIAGNDEHAYGLFLARK